MKKYLNGSLKGITLFLLIVMICLPLFSCDDMITDHGDDRVIFTDALGREISVQKKPERVAALIGSFAEIWQLSGGELCASADEAWRDLGLAMGDAVNIGGAHSPNSELLISSKPDLVIASASTASNVDLIELLSSLGIIVAYFDVDNFSDYLHMLDICTRITDRRDLYEKHGLMQEERIETLKTNYKNFCTDHGENRILILRASSSSVKVKGSEGTVLGEMLLDIGCVNIADNDKNLLEGLSIESIIAEDPDSIFVVTMGDNTEAAYASIKALFDENPALGGLRAVREGRVHVMERELYNMKPNARFAEAYENLYEILTEK